MKDKIVDFETTYFLNKRKECQNAFAKNEYQKVIDIINAPLSKIDNMLDVEIYCPQNVFDKAIFLNYLGKEVKQTSFSKINYYDFYMMAAESQFALDNKKEARELFKKAIKLNPASSRARGFELLISIQLNDYEDFLAKIQDALFFAYNRADMALFYKMLGDYLLHIGDHEMGMVSYNLSMTYKPDETIVQIIRNTAKDLNLDIESNNYLSENYMRKFHNTYNIPLMPNSKLSDLAIKMGEDAYNKKAYKAAKFSYEIAYELTYDETIKKKVEELNGKV